MSRWSLAFGLAIAASGMLAGPVAAAAPVAVNDNAATNEDTPVVINVLANDYDPDGDGVSIASFTQPANGSVVRNPNAGSVTYTPRLNFNGPDSFSYTISDGLGGTATALVSIFVTPVNDPPVAFAGVAKVPENGSVDIAFGGGDPDKERCDLIFIAEAQTSHGTLGPWRAGFCNANGDYVLRTYTPNPGYSGPDTIGFVVSDGTVQSAPALIAITVTPVNEPPVVAPISVTGAYETPVVVTLAATDADTCELLFRVTQPSHGSVSTVTSNPCTSTPGTPNRDTSTVTYTPAAGFVGSDSFTYSASDGSTSTSATVTVTIPAPRLHVADLDATTAKAQKGWLATAVVRVASAAGVGVRSATVAGTWNGVAGTCTTGAAGTCTITSPVLPRKTATATFTVTAVSLAPYVYDAAANSDPDGDSNGTSIQVRRP